MSKKSMRKQLFWVKVLAIIGAIIFLIIGVNSLYEEIRSSTGMNKSENMDQTVENNVTSTPDAAVMEEQEEIVTDESENDQEKSDQDKSESVAYDSEDSYLLAKIAMAEAESEGVEGKALVILVVLNRVKSDRFPNSVSEVIFQQGQFSPVRSGRYDSVEPDQECYEALELVQLEGWDKSQGALYFESEDTLDWYKNNLHFLFQYGNHYFYTDKESVEWEE